ncbi:unnamed protein product [Adineta steineri]|uniref:Uncharacterized protein n=1 Tax=Adineta steineri TaxID=433720 RepID=A0A814E716_9BILA|nr:unnamed protein product [Adineta steineri]CAF0895185.1 unnamed protein product [Adineta steineri]CAF0963941.1 unnamed protein product [Adineta steineri]
MAASYLTTDIIVIIVLVIVIVLIGVCAFLLHYYWTKIGVSEIWNTAKWSSMRQSVYKTLSRLSRSNNSKYVDDDALSGVSVHSYDQGDGGLEKKKSSPVITSIYTPTNINSQKPVSVTSYDNSTRQNNTPRTVRSIDNVKVHNNNNNNNNRHGDLSSKIQKQRF